MPNTWDKHLMQVVEWEHSRGMMHGLANREIRKKSGGMDVFQKVEVDDNTYPEGTIIDEALKQLRELTATNKNPFFLAVGIIKPHLTFRAPKHYYDKYSDAKLPKNEPVQKPDGKTTWHGSNEFMKYNRCRKED